MALVLSKDDLEIGWFALENMFPLTSGVSGFAWFVEQMLHKLLPGFWSMVPGLVLFIEHLKKSLVCFLVLISSVHVFPWPEFKS